MHRSLIAVIPAALLCLVEPASAAPVARGLSPLPSQLSTRCARLAQIPRSSEIALPVFAAHVSVANCTAEEAMNRLSLAPDDASIDRLNTAVAPSIAMLDEVISAGSPYWKMVAEDAKRDIYVGMVVRMRSSIPDADLAKHDALEPKLARWIDEGEKSRSAVTALAGQHPEVSGRDVVVAGIVERNSTTRSRVARRPARSR